MSAFVLFAFLIIPLISCCIAANVDATTTTNIAVAVQQQMHFTVDKAVDFVCATYTLYNENFFVTAINGVTGPKLLAQMRNIIQAKFLLNGDQQSLYRSRRRPATDTAIRAHAFAEVVRVYMAMYNNRIRAKCAAEIGSDGAGDSAKMLLFGKRLAIVGVLGQAVKMCQQMIDAIDDGPTMPLVEANALDSCVTWENGANADVKTLKKRLTLLVQQYLAHCHRMMVDDFKAVYGGGQQGMLVVTDCLKIVEEATIHIDYGTHP